MSLSGQKLWPFVLIRAESLVYNRILYCFIFHLQHFRSQIRIRIRIGIGIARNKRKQSLSLAMGKCDLCASLYVKMSATIWGVEAQINFNGRQDLESLRSPEVLKVETCLVIQYQWGKEQCRGRAERARAEPEPETQRSHLAGSRAKYSPEASSNFLPLALGIIVH